MSGRTLSVTPRSTLILPGLTSGYFDAEWRRPASAVLSGPTSDRTITASEAAIQTAAPPFDLWIFVASLLAMTVQRVQERLFR